MNKFFTYAIYNEIRCNIYIGHTNDLENRMKRHNGIFPSKSRSYTKINSGYWQLVYKESFPTRKEAMKREKELKSARGRKFIWDIILKNKPPIA